MTYIPELSPSATAFGEAVTAELTPIAQLVATYGFSPTAFAFAAGDGSTSASNKMFSCSSGTAINQVSTVLTKVHAKYRAGQGVMARATAIFDTPVAGNVQQVGLLTATDVFAFGYSGTAFGVMREHGGETEIQELQITTAATGAENAAVTIDGVGYTVALTSGTVQHNAYEIAVSLTSQNDEFLFTSNDDAVVVAAIDSVARSTFTFSSSTAVGAFTQITAGAKATREFIAQADWSEDLATGLDATKGNVYQVQAQYLGFGAINFFIEESSTGKFVLVHRIKYANSNTSPSVGNPTFRAGILSRNETSTTSTTVKSASIACFVEGKLLVLNQPGATSNTQASVGVTQTSVIHARVRSVFGSVRNRINVNVLGISGFTDGSKGAIVEVRRNAIISGDLDYQYLDKDGSVMEVANDAVTVTGGQLLFTAAVGGSSMTLDLKPLGIRLEPSETITVSMAVTASPSAGMTATIYGVEDN